MRDHHAIPEFGPTASATLPAPKAVVSPANAMRRRFRKPGSVAEIRQRRLREVGAIEWSLFLNGNLITSRMFQDEERVEFDHEIERVTSDLANAGWLEDLDSVA